jgi:uncharacterized protein YciI
MPYFFMKLIPPRPTFAQDMTADERKIMDEHGAYWTDLQSKGFAIVFGPVIDPKGSWGMGVIEADDESQVQGFKENDPTVKAGTHAMEIYPMKAVIRCK